ncbi:MAG TPA: MotA/TolQ/ExbB proton channel family protein, partial [Pseudomonadales bacterium]|nr:MotA/TolQ/ExbB proton channel family protein [Pseudomonadales bacterium]
EAQWSKHMHAGRAIERATQLIIEICGGQAGPVGEALIMTAIGLFTAIPAVLAYNAFNRVQRLIIADLDGFAHDLLMYFTMGSSKKTKGNL